MRVVIFFEGGGTGRIDREVRQAFKRFLDRAGFRGGMPAVVPCGSRTAALKSFETESTRPGSDVWPILLVDSEAPVLLEHREKPWDHLATVVVAGGSDRSKQLTRPHEARNDHAFLMVQCMESWFLADPEWLARYFGQQFHAGSVPAGNNVEGIDVARVMDGLKSATRHCKKDKRYSEKTKGRHSFEILAGLDPTKVERASPHAKRLFDTLRAKGSVR
ncbi:DUF4276 family protein [Tautonia rosea]|uniref:DUF4276 family protein n=1 Tax=Tautonia rosea TaxID=2728037 RepID=UPI001475495A|nr:DUF4276 family protein [Tautonia rosea]